MYLRAKYTKYKMAKTKFSIWRYIICEICKKNGSNRPFLASRVADTIFPPPIEGHHRQLDNQCKDPMDNNKDCRVGQLTNSIVAHMRARETISVLWHSFGIGFVCAGIVLLSKRGSVNSFLYHCCCLEPDSSTVHSSCLTLFSITVEAYCSSTEAYNACWKS